MDILIMWTAMIVFWVGFTKVIVNIGKNIKGDENAHNNNTDRGR